MAKAKPRMQKGLNKNAVATGKGVPVASDGSGSNTRAAQLDSPGIKKGKQPKVGMTENDARKGSAVGSERPANNGGPRRGQTAGSNIVDTKIGDSGKHGHGTGKGFDFYKAAR